MTMGRPKGARSVKTTKQTVQFFHEHIVKGKTITAAAKKLGLCRKTLHGYKNSNEFRQMAIEHLEDSKLNGLLGTVSKLVTALEAKRAVVVDDADGGTHIKMVADQKTRMTALQEVIKIYGLHAPIKKDVTASISISSDAEIFDEIEVAERASRYVESYVQGETGLELATGEQGARSENARSRERTLLLADAVSESE